MSAAVMTVEPDEISLGILELGCRRRITWKEAVRSLQCALSIPGLKGNRARLLCWMVDDVQVDDPVGMEGRRLKVYIGLEI